MLKIRSIFLRTEKMLSDRRKTGPGVWEPLRISTNANSKICIFYAYRVKKKPGRFKPKNRLKIKK